MARGNLRFYVSVKLTLSGFLLKMLSSSVVGITSNVQQTKTVNTGRILGPLRANTILLSPLRDSMHILSLFTSISKNTPQFIIDEQGVARSRQYGK